jgi:hypothetical protein
MGFAHFVDQARSPMLLCNSAHGRMFRKASPHSRRMK